MLARQLRTTKERTLFRIAAAISVFFWLLVVVSLLGIAYALAIGLFVVIGHAMFLAWVTGNGLRIGPRQLPELHAKVVEASRVLGLPNPPEVYVIQEGGMLNAFATKLFSRSFIILLSDLLDACEAASGEEAPSGPTTIDFVIGHEIGHLAAGHLAWQAFLLPARILPWIGPAYARACEYTCDACGHAFVRDLEVASRAIAVLVAGGAHGRRVDLDQLVEQRLDSGRFWAAVWELNATHPYPSKRVAALRELERPGSMAPVRRNILAYPLAPVLAAGGGGGGTALVVIAVIGILAAVAVPGLLAAREAAALARLSLDDPNGPYGFDTESSGSTRLALTFDVPADTSFAERAAILAQAETVARLRLGLAGLTGWRTVSNASDGLLMVQLADLEDTARARRVLTPEGRLTVRTVYGEGDRTTLEGELASDPGRKEEILPASSANPLAGPFFAVSTEPIADSRDIIAAAPTTDDLGQAGVSLSLSADGAERLQRYGAEHIGVQLAFVVDGTVVMAPMIEGPLGSQILVSGAWSAQEAEELAVALQAGAWPAQATVGEP